jgi:L,D-transpeptidase ErfK/SrfK
MFSRLLLFLGLLFLSAPLHANTYYYSSDSDIVGELQFHRVASGDTWDSIGYYYDVGYDELLRANPNVRNLSRYVGHVIVIPTQFILPQKQYRKGIVVNLAEKRLYYFLDDHTVLTYPVSVGKSGWQTPSFYAKVNRKKIAPVWYVPDSINNYHYKKYGKRLPKRVPAGPNNPLGNYAIYLTKPRILIHGTNSEKMIGSEVSSGCIRMFNRNIQELFFLVPIGTPVRFIHEDEKIGVDDGYIYLEKHPAYYVDDNDNVYIYLDDMQDDYDNMVIDKDTLRKEHMRSTGVPVRVGVVEGQEEEIDIDFDDDDSTWRP